MLFEDTTDISSGKKDRDMKLYTELFTDVYWIFKYNWPKKKKRLLHAVIFCKCSAFCAFIVARFQKSYATSQNVFPLKVALIFGKDLVLTMGELNHSVKSTTAHPKIFSGAQDSVVANSCVKMIPHVPWTIFYSLSDWILASSS